MNRLFNNCDNLIVAICSTGLVILVGDFQLLSYIVNILYGILYGFPDYFI